MNLLGTPLLYTFTAEDSLLPGCRVAEGEQRPAIVTRVCQKLDEEGNPVGEATYNVQILVDGEDDFRTSTSEGANGFLWRRGLSLAQEPTPGKLSPTELARLFLSDEDVTITFDKKRPKRARSGKDEG